MTLRSGMILPTVSKRTMCHWLHQELSKQGMLCDEVIKQDKTPPGTTALSRDSVNLNQRTDFIFQAPWNILNWGMVVN